MILDQWVGEAWTSSTGELLAIHLRSQCAGTHCAIHNPSHHHMQTWPLNIRFDRADFLAERICEHGVGHPDPDSLAYIVRRDPGNTWSGIHGCDGCCRPPYDGAEDAALPPEDEFNAAIHDFIDNSGKVVSL